MLIINIYNKFAYSQSSKLFNRLYDLIEIKGTVSDESYIGKCIEIVNNDKIHVYAHDIKNNNIIHIMLEDANEHFGTLISIINKEGKFQSTTKIFELNNFSKETKILDKNTYRNQSEIINILETALKNYTEFNERKCYCDNVFQKIYQTVYSNGQTSSNVPIKSVSINKPYLEVQCSVNLRNKNILYISFDNLSYINDCLIHFTVIKNEKYYSVISKRCDRKDPNFKVIDEENITDLKSILDILELNLKLLLD